MDDFFRYATHINGQLNREYVIRAAEEFKIIETRFKDLGLAGSEIVGTVLAIDRYVATAGKGANALIIQRPTKPQKVSPKVGLILALSVVLGGIVGAFFILVRNANKKRKQQVVKA